MALNKNIVFYLVMAIIVIAIIYVLASIIIHPSYNIAVHLYNSSSANLYPFNTTDFAIVINNTGNSGVSDMLVGFYLDGSALHLYNASIPAHKGAVIYTNYTYTTNGTYSFSAIADPAHVLDIPNREAASSSITVNVSQNSGPEPYSSMPNNGMVSSYNFTLYQNTGPVFARLASSYNVSIINSELEPNITLMSSILSDIFGTINATHGAVADYSNGTSAYVLWLQGTTGPGIINKIIGSFGYRPNALANGITMFNLGNNTSMCTYFEGGWTRIISYRSPSNQTCSALSVLYAPLRGNYVRSAINSTPYFVNYTDRFFYTNTTYLGGGVSEGSVSLSAFNIFQSPYGIFLSYINKTATNNSNPGKCMGLLSNNSAVCSVDILPISGSSVPGALVKSEELTSNYRIELYSFVNTTNAVNAHLNAYDLIKALNISQPPLSWAPAFNNTCSIPVNGIACKVTAFNYTADTANLNITNNLNSSFRLNYDSCYISGLQVNETINNTIPSHSSLSSEVKCHNIPIPLLSAMTSYNLYVNYTLDNSTHSALGSLNVTNQI
ncbi:MAG: hypothetical protein QXR73_01520 [Candidatus Micrarchaeaceae archaeon]